MAPTICSGKKFKTRILSSDVKRRKRDNSNNNPATVYDILKQHALSTFERDIINNSLPLNLTCNKLTKISEKINTTTSNCSDKNSYIANNIESHTRLTQADAVKHINCNTKTSEGEIPLSMFMIPSPLCLTTLPNHRTRRCSASSTSISDASSDIDNNNEELIDDDYDDTASVVDDYQFHIHSIDDKKRRFYNTIISGNFSESENENDTDSTSSIDISNNNSIHSNGDTNDDDNNDQLQNIDTHEKDKSSMLIRKSDGKISLTSSELVSHSTDDLLAIAIKTVKLAQRNQLLQQRLNQLQLETSAFIESVLNNPENRHFREKVLQKVNKITNI